MNLDDIIAEFGAYYLGASAEANRARIITLLHRKSVTAQQFQTLPTDATRWRASKATITRVLQPFQKQFTPLGTATFTPLWIDAFGMKIDNEEYPDDLEPSWLGFLTDNDLDRREWPFIRWYVEEMLIPQAQEDYEMYEIWAGVYEAPTPGTPGAAGTAMDGIRKLINDSVAASTTTPIVTGALETTPEAFVEQMEAFCDAIDRRYWRMGLTLNMDEGKAKLYRRGYRAKYGKDTDFNGESSSVKDTNVVINGLPSMDTSEKIWCTPPTNAKRLIRKSQNMSKMRIEVAKRQVALYTDWWDGVGFVLGELIFTNDQDLVDA